jgi:hypothetical protein
MDVILLYNHPWRDLKVMMCQELNRRPHGDMLLTNETWNWLEMQAFQKAANGTCEEVLYEDSREPHNQKYTTLSCKSDSDGMSYLFEWWARSAVLSKGGSEFEVMISGQSMAAC